MTANEVLAQRELSYGSFKDNMLNISILKNHIIPLLGIHLDKKVISPSDYSLINTTIDFTITMVSLKAIRSITAKDDVYEDCLIDFQNYMKLCDDIICDIEGVSYMADFSQVLYFNPKVFNPELNSMFKKNIDIRFLLNKDFISKLKGA